MWGEDLVDVQDAIARVAEAMAAGDPPVMVRDYQTDLGHVDLDPCNLHPGEAEAVAQRLTQILSADRPANATGGSKHGDRLACEIQVHTCQHAESSKEFNFSPQTPPLTSWTNP